MFQLCRGGFGSGGTGDEHDPQAASERVLVQPHDLAKAAPDAVAHDRVADAFRGDESCSELSVVAGRQNAHNKQRATMNCALVLDSEELSRAGQASRL